MIKTNIEFVTFDAKDVIATSGPFNAQPLAVQIGVLHKYNSANRENPDVQLWNNIGNSAGINETKANNWLWYGVEGEAAGYGDESSGVLYLRSANAESSTAKPTDKDYFYVSNNDDFTLIGEWLRLQQ